MQLILVGEWQSVPVPAADTAAASPIEAPRAAIHDAAQRATWARDPAVGRDGCDSIGAVDETRRDHATRDQLDARASRRTLEILATILPVEWG